jgi:ferredoxin-thioredoxin reductase catalytic subunit/glutaredoxin
MLAKLAPPHEVFEVDLMSREERRKVLDELKEFNPACSFPTTVVDDRAIVGYKIQEIKETIGIRTEVDDLFEKLKTLNEKKGYFFNANRERTFDLLRGLLTNKDRYGYMACPCRLAAGEKEADKDIFCPCVYREPDVKEYGSCYCGLYVSADWNAGKLERVVVPERRPPELMS